MRLYELAENYKAVSAMLESDEANENMDAILDTLEAIEEDIKDKADNIACMLKDIESDITAINDEAKKLKERASGLEKKKTWLKGYLQMNIENAGLTKIETARNVIKLTSGERVTVDDNFVEWASASADEFLTYKTPEPNKTMIKKALKEGKNFGGHAWIETSKNVIIK